MNHSVPLSLVRTSRPSLEVSAGWLASNDPVEWLREVAHCRRQGCAVALYPVAASAVDPRAAGVLLIPKGGTLPVFRPRVMPLVETLPGVHVPHDADLPVGLLPNERAYLFPFPLSFFHPSRGVIGFDPKDELSPAKLLLARERRAAPWNWAVPAPEPFPSLQTVLVALPPEPDAMLEDAARDIGNKADQPPPALPGIVGKIGMFGVGAVGGTVLGLGWLLGKLVPSGLPGSGNRGGTGASGSGEGPLDALRKWAEKNWQQLMDKRGREIQRLMDLMDKNPDEGLRYALPLTGTGASRGAATPGWQLGVRNTRFRLGGGGAVDGWDIDAEARLALENRYREAAAREIALGRYERAAYILGNLLGDWNGAARALADAGRLQDAVSIYLHKLHNPVAAARCLEDAGLLAQAADLYTENKQFEKAGDLQARLGNQTEARRLWLLAAENQPDLFEKARIYHEKLEDHDGALSHLETIWKAGNRPVVALQRMFGMLRELNRQPAAIQLLDRMFTESRSSIQLVEKVRLGIDEADLRREDAEFRRVLENHSYRQMGEALSGDASNVTELMALLPRFDPQDRLLVRDAKRYAVPRRKSEVPTKSKRVKGVLWPAHIVKIPMAANWQSIAPTKLGVSMVGHAGGMLAVAQWQEKGCHASALKTPDDPGGNAQVCHLTIRSSRGVSRLFHFPGHDRLHYRALDRSRQPEDDALGGLRAILAAGMHGAGDEFMLLEYTATGSLSVRIYSEMAQLRRTLPIDFAPPAVAGLKWFCAGRGGHLCFTAEGFFVWRHPKGTFESIAMDEHPAGLELSPSPESPVALVQRRREILIVEPGKPGKPLETINLHSTVSGPRAVACFTQNGDVVVGDGSQGVIYAPGRWDAVQDLKFPPDAGHPIDVCTWGEEGFVFLTSEGKLLFFS